MCACVARGIEQYQVISHDWTTMPAMNLGPLTGVGHVWLVFILVTFGNAAVWWWRGRPEMIKNPSLEAGYRRLIRGFLIHGNIPWLILGAGAELPRLFPTLPFGWLFAAFLVSIVGYAIAAFYWLLFRGGAEDLAAHPGLFRGGARDPQVVKAEFAAILAILVTMFVVVAFFAFRGAIPWPSLH
jgi:hypothetical protein